MSCCFDYNFLSAPSYLFEPRCLIALELAGPKQGGTLCPVRNLKRPYSLSN